MRTSLVDDPHVERAVAVLADRVGFRFDVAARSRLVRCLRDLARAASLTVDDYVATLDHDETRLDGLLEELTVQESSFFRHPAQFEALDRQVLPFLDGPLTIWTAGCANGQEPYSVAMLLAESGRDDWRIVATDISRHALARTERGAYPERELRGLEPWRQARHGHWRDDLWQVRSELRERVTVMRRRIAHDPIPVGSGECDLLLCRNVLIYLTPHDIAQFMHSAARALKPGGLLLLGGSESLHHVESGLKLARFGDVFAYRKPEPDTDAFESGIRALAASAAPGPPVLPTVDDLVRRGGEASNTGDFALAVELFRQATYLAPLQPLPHVLLGLALEGLADLASARRAFSAAWEALGNADPRELAASLDGHDPAALVHLLADKLRQAA